MAFRDDNIIGIDHLAIAVPDLSAAIEWLHTMIGFEVEETRETQGAESGMKSAVMRLGPITFVLVEGIGEKSQVTRFVAEHGPGVQHVAFRVRSLSRAIESMSRQRLSFCTPRLESDSLSQIFSHRDPSTGLMVELIERRDFDGFRDENVLRLFESLEEQNLV